MTHSARLVRVAALARALLIATTVSPTLAQSPKRGSVFRLPASDAVSLDPHDPGIDGFGLGTRLTYVWIDP